MTTTNFQYNDKVKQINPCPWISGGVYNPTELKWTSSSNKRRDRVRIEGTDGNPIPYCHPSAQDHIFLFKKQWKHKPNLCYCQGVSTGRVYTFKIDSIVLI
jgi:hypothetical protein